MARALFESGKVSPGAISGTISLTGIEADVLPILPFLDWVEWYGKYTVRQNGNMIGTVHYGGKEQQNSLEAFTVGARTSFTPSNPAQVLEFKLALEG